MRFASVPLGPLDLYCKPLLLVVSMSCLDPPISRSFPSLLLLILCSALPMEWWTGGGGGEGLSLRWFGKRKVVKDFRKRKKMSVYGGGFSFDACRLSGGGLASGVVSPLFVRVVWSEDHETGFYSRGHNEVSPFVNMLVVVSATAGFPRFGSRCRWSELRFWEHKRKEKHVKRDLPLSPNTSRKGSTDLVDTHYPEGAFGLDDGKKKNHWAKAISYIDSLVAFSLVLSARGLCLFTPYPRSSGLEKTAVLRAIMAPFSRSNKPVIVSWYLASAAEFLILGAAVVVSLYPMASGCFTSWYTQKIPHDVNMGLYVSVRARNSLYTAADDARFGVDLVSSVTPIWLCVYVWLVIQKLTSDPFPTTVTLLHSLGSIDVFTILFLASFVAPGASLSGDRPSEQQEVGISPNPEASVCTSSLGTTFSTSPMLKGMENILPWWSLIVVYYKTQCKSYVVSRWKVDSLSLGYYLVICVDSNVFLLKIKNFSHGAPLWKM